MSIFNFNSRAEKRGSFASFISNLLLKSALSGALVVSGGGLANADVTIEENSAAYGGAWFIYGSGVYESALNTNGADIQVDMTKRLTGSSTSITFKGDLAAGSFRHVDSEIKNDSGVVGNWASVQNGTLTFDSMTANFSGDYTAGGHSNLILANGATVNVAGTALIGNSMTLTLRINSGTTWNSNGNFFINQGGTQAIVYVSGILNANSSEANSVRFGNGNNYQYTSSLNIDNGGVLNVLNTVAHAGYDGQIYFNINSGGTANLYGLTIARNGDEGSQYGDAAKTLYLNGGTLNLGAGGLFIREGKDSYPIQLKSGTIGVLAGQDTFIQNVEIAVGSGVTYFAPEEGRKITVSSNFVDSTLSKAGSGGLIQMTGAGTLELAGTFNTTTGFKASAGSTIVSGTFAGGQLLVDGGALTIASTGNLTSTSGMTVAKGAATLAGASAATSSITVNSGAKLYLSYLNGGSVNAQALAPVTVKLGGEVVISIPEGGKATTDFFSPIILNGGKLSTDSIVNNWRRLFGKITLTADSEIRCDTRLQLHGGLEGAGFTLTKNGNADLILDQVGLTGLKKIVTNSGLFCIQSNSNQALQTEEGVFVNGGTLQFWGQSNVKANVFMNGGMFQTSGSDLNSTTDDFVMTFQKNTTVDNSGWDDPGTDSERSRFVMNGKWVATDGIVVNKTGNRSLTLAGNLDDFDGTLKLSTFKTYLDNGGNSSATPYDFAINLAGGALEILNSGLYVFKSVDNLINFTSDSNASVNLGNGKIQVLGDSSIASSAADAKIVGVGSLELGDADSSIQFNVADGKALTIEANVNTSGGAYSKTGNGTLTINSLNAVAGVTDLRDVAADSTTVKSVSVADGAKLALGDLAPTSLTTESGATLLVDITGTADSWSIDALDLTELAEASLDEGMIFELTTDIEGTLSEEYLLANLGNILLAETADDSFEGLKFDVNALSIFPNVGDLYALGTANGIFLVGSSFDSVPEPSAWILLSLGLGGLTLLRRKRVVAK